MPKWGDSRRKRLQAKRRKLANAERRVEKQAKRERNSGKGAAAAGQ